MLLKDYVFGYADASKEYLLKPDIIEMAFFDQKDILNKLKNDWKYMLVGRKGVGKSAYNAKLQSISESTNDFITEQIQLNDFEYSTFAKGKSDNVTLGTKKYFDSWEFILLFSIYNVFSKIEMFDDSAFNEIEELLGKFDFYFNDTFKKCVTKVSKIKLGTNVGVFDAAYETEFGTKPFSFSDRINALIQKMLENLKKIHIDQKIYMLIDGVDDVLRFKKSQLDIISSLIRTIDTLNEYFVRERINVKIIIFMREDILSNITDPDLNKIKRDGAVNLSWCDNTNDLKSIVNLRFKLSERESEFDKTWYNIFPNKVKESDSWEYLLDHTLYKPRDVLQFLVVCQDLYSNKESLSYSEMTNVLKTYSRDYFIEEMKNELSGFSNDDLIILLPSLFQKIGSRSFYFNELLKIANEQSNSQKYSEQDIKYLLYLLFQSGYVGQIVVGNRGKSSVVFKYRNPNANVDYSQKFISHRGLHKGLGIIV